MIVITGASSGIGRELAKICIQKKLSDSTILISRNDPNLDGSIWLKADFRKENDLIKVSDFLKNKSDKLDFMVHCSGIMKSCQSNKLNLEELKDSFMVNTIAPIFITSALTRHLAKAKGTVIAISSIASSLDIPGETIYSSSKAALDKGFDSLAADLSRLGICFLKIHPSLIDTPMTTHLNESQREYMINCQSTKKNASAYELAEYIFSLKNSNNFTTGSSIYFGGLRR